jgi:transglutaminase-like putative cysteine protease
MKTMLAEYLVKDAPHMEVTDEFQKIADGVCGAETSIAAQAQKLLEHVASTVDHYSYSSDPNMPSCGLGDSKICKKQGGGCCTDLNSYFITIARARGIPTRLKMGYRLQSKYRDQVVDPGYRCWVEYFVPGAGWISADVVEADTPNGLGHERWLTGLTSRRVYLNLVANSTLGLTSRLAGLTT